MKIKAFIFFVSALLFTSLQGCGSGYVNNNSGSDIQNNNYQDNPPYPEYNIDDLNQYGNWVNYDSYGRVWQPSVAPGWQPFTNGHWAFDGNDWVWVSYEPFGWMVYHYGSWENTPDYGWVWIPEHDAWSPACVDWVYYDDQVCWAPRRPQNRYWSEPWEQNNIHPWVVVRMEDFNRENVASYRMNNVPRAANIQIAQRRQPDIKIVQSRVKEPIQTVRFERQPVQRNPVRTEVTPPPVRNDGQPPARNPNPTRTSTQNDKPIYHMQIPPQERQKVDKYRPKVEKDVLRKKPPANNNRNKDTKDKDRK